MRKSPLASMLFASMLAVACGGGNTEPVEPFQPAAPANEPDDAPAHGDHAHGGHDHANHGGHAVPGGHNHSFEDADEWAKVFDDPDRDAWQRPTEVVALLAIAPGMVVADLGAGTGYFLPHLSRAVGDGGRVLALDVEPNMVHYMKERAKREKLPNIEARKVPYDSPALDKGSVDRVLVVDTWHHIADRPGYAKQLATALRPGGFVMVVDFTMETTMGPPKAARVTPEQVMADLQAGGLKAELATETLPEQFVVIGRKQR